MRTSFRARLFLLVITLLAAALLATTLAALRASNASVESLLREELTVVERVFLQLLEREREQLRERGEVLAADFAFKQAIATGDRGTIASALANHADRIDADLVSLLAPSGNVIMSTHDLAPARELLRRATGGASTQRTVRLALADGVYDTVLLPVRAPDLIGRVALGRLLDRELLLELREITGADITLFNGSNAGTRSTLPAALAPGEEDATPATLATSLADAGWLTRPVTLPADAGAGTRVLLSVSLADALEDWRQLRRQLVIIGAVALVLAGAFALYFARRITQPIRRLTRFAGRISQGDYSTRSDIATGTEFDLLADTLNHMQNTVAEREARIAYQAQHDVLTQLPNRNYLSALLAGEAGEAPRGHYGMVLMEIVNLDSLTDLYGGDFSDRCLREAARRLRTLQRDGDLGGRVSDNEILLLVDGLEPERLEDALQRLEGIFAEAMTIEGVPVTLEPRFGCVFHPQHGHSFDELLRRAQIALARARRNAEPFAVYRSGDDEAHLRQIRVANRLRSALADEAFTVLFQPKYSLREKRVTGCETLVRWTDEELGPVYPDEFIPIAEQTGMITGITERVLRAACDEVRVLREAHPGFGVSVNLSGIDVLQPGFIDTVLERLETASLPVEALVLEITETAMMEDLDAARSRLDRLAETGIALSIDDFGTGFSSLGQLRALPVVELKLDRSFIEAMDRIDGDRKIVASTIDMAHHLGLRVVAEGVENMEIVSHLAELGCDVLQGYYIARPMSGEALVAWLAEPPLQVAQLGEVAVA